jgi:hypothetical protein
MVIYIGNDDETNSHRERSEQMRVRAAQTNENVFTYFSGQAAIVSSLCERLPSLRPHPMLQYLYHETSCNYWLAWHGQINLCL